MAIKLRICDSTYICSGWNTILNILIKALSDIMTERRIGLYICDLIYVRNGILYLPDSDKQIKVNFTAEPANEPKRGPQIIANLYTDAYPDYDYLVIARKATRTSADTIKMIAAILDDLEMDINTSTTTITNIGKGKELSGSIDKLYKEIMCECKRTEVK